VIEAAGTSEAWEQAIALAEPGGTVVLFGGLPRETIVPVDSYRLHYEALTLRGSFHHRPRDVRAALALLERAASSIGRLLTHEFALADVVEPLRRGAGLAPRDGLLKAVIRP
jgi:L-iditol 2-dehydrogenase